MQNDRVGNIRGVQIKGRGLRKWDFGMVFVKAQLYISSKTGPAVASLVA